MWLGCLEVGCDVCLLSKIENVAADSLTSGTERNDIIDKIQISMCSETEYAQHFQIFFDIYLLWQINTFDFEGYPNCVIRL